MLDIWVYYEESFFRPFGQKKHSYEIFYGKKDKSTQKKCDQKWGPETSQVSSGTISQPDKKRNVDRNKLALPA